ncbi:hypothetical protein Patl1_33152 [Pistacia atlantica]|uniref:Uncharacterized protein n=1 Tax=Pistacia atlantica TaxID=434234 RepID=A0ACC1AND8_9ROSI|nr:hypothetical protein Patl1_33152 [Pistacia atlantica]
MLFYESLGRCPICNSKLEFDGKRYTCKGMYREWSTCTFRTKDPPRREEPVKIPDSVLKSVDLDVYFWTIHSSSLQLRLDCLSNVTFLCIYLSSISLCNS